MYVELPAAREHYFSEIDLSARAGTEQQSDSVPTRKQHQLKSVVTHQRSGGASYLGPLSGPERTRFAHV